MKNKIINPIIFIGTGRSGTTIISEIIMRHPELAYISNYNKLLHKYPIIGLIRFLFVNKLWRFYGEKNQLQKEKINIF